MSVLTRNFWAIFLEKIEQIQATFAEFCSNFLEILDQLVAEAN